jgi:signal transduction histidine kinase
MAIIVHQGSGAAGDEIQITVQDNGPGIDPEDMPHIFEPFYRGAAARFSHVHGTGLGLSLARDMAEAMGGMLTVTSILGKGSSFTLHLPAAAGAESPQLEKAYGSVT